MRTTFLLFILISSLIVTGQNKKFPKKLDQKVIPVIEYSHLWIDQYEVTIGDWFAFMYFYYNSGFSNDELESFAPDLSQIPGKLQHLYAEYLGQYANDHLSESYYEGYNSGEIFPIPEMDNLENLLSYPVTGISFQQVEEYLHWREELINSDKRVEKSGYYIQAKLPSPSEWDQLASFHGPRDLGNETIYPDSMNTHGCYLMNIRYITPCESTQFLLDRHGEGLFPSGSYIPDISGIYDLFGNVAEMTAQEGIAKGGSYVHWAREGRTEEVISYEGSAPWLGFRVWFEFIEEE